MIMRIPICEPTELVAKQSNTNVSFEWGKGPHSMSLFVILNLESDSQECFVRCPMIARCHGFAYYPAALLMYVRLPSLHLKWRIHSSSQNDSITHKTEW